MARVSACGVDPGGTTGLFRIALWHDDTVAKISRAQLSPEEVVSHLRAWLLEEPTTVVFIERYFITQRTVKMSRQPTALEVTGAVKNLCTETENVVRTQAKSDASKMAHDSVLREIGWYKPGMRHANDAAKHVLLGMSKTHPMDFRRIITCGIVATES